MSVSAAFRKSLAYWACIAAYNTATTDQFSQVLTVEDVTICIRYEGLDTVVVFPGSEKLLDWRDDFEALPFSHPKLGILHLGFWKFIPEVVDKIQPLIRGDVYLGGHSLGAAHAAGVAAELGLRGVKTKFLAMFEAPRVGWLKFAMHLKTCVEDAVLTWNGLDPVDMAPPPPWRDSWEITRMEGLPGGLADLNPCAYHMGQIVYDTYCARLQGIE